MLENKKSLVLRGLYPATITPFKTDLTLDYEALAQHLQQTARTPGVKGIAVNAGLAEILQLSDEEKIKILALAREVMLPGQILISGIEGRGPSAVKDGLLAKNAGADALLVLNPFDARPYRRLAQNPDSVYQFYKMLDEQVDLPMIVFQYPDPSGCAYSLDSLEKIASIRNVVAIKAACGTVTRYVQIWEKLHDKLTILAALDSPPLLGMLLHGVHGALIGISVIDTPQWVDLIDAAMRGDATKAQKIHRDFCIPIMDGVFENQEPSSATSEVACVKEALVQLGQIPNSLVRPPAVDVTDTHRSHVRHGLIASGLLKN
ncbi:dihydrodipicolinate synthase family protein [Polynucleobacter sp. CS-Odin-A6]|uniref:dihydrodipicolinate synthase family protein n=1 Tax=Polynucleobacter sp. CS-Odin-A6 TaxID=2689106 RepID=UPI001C0E2F71|nr:dihydrodipicolinate synthase family protein [Polynucleobacter sp. CS-Odin-A6]MBU3620791.1 dihydrodipicolinate synthase family protein [Polynucleobacter sp. CS-Odin-A6]